jgi:hypothetical protein
LGITEVGYSENPHLANQHGEGCRKRKGIRRGRVIPVPHQYCTEETPDNRTIHETADKLNTRKYMIGLLIFSRVFPSPDLNCHHNKLSDCHDSKMQHKRHFRGQKTNRPGGATTPVEAYYNEPVRS